MHSIQLVIDKKAKPFPSLVYLSILKIPCPSIAPVREAILPCISDASEIIALKWCMSLTPLFPYIGVQRLKKSSSACYILRRCLGNFFIVLPCMHFLASLHMLEVAPVITHLVDFYDPFFSHHSILFVQ